MLPAAAVTANATNPPQRHEHTCCSGGRALERQAVVGEDANATLRQRNDTLARQVLELQEGTEMLEAVAREELGLVREGEEYILFIDEKPEEKAP